MYGYISGYTDTGSIFYCPACGARVTELFADGTCKCGECGMRFGVVEVDDESEEK